tara:strand:- start:28 stop:693 length:666 start_codon:yes stop_codon:yes gene_type:complete
MKKCTKCNVEKPLTEFNKCRSFKDGLNYNCKGCIRKYREENIDKITKYKIKYNKKNRDKYKKYYQKNKDKILQRQSKYYQKNKDKIKSYTNEWMKKWRVKNPHVASWRNILSRTLKYLNESKKSPTETMLGYSAIELKQHLDNLGMNWGTHHIDHIIPLSWFKKDTPTHIVNDLRNLQPLLEHENRTKGNKFTLQNNQEYISEIKQWIKDNKLKHLNNQNI